MIQSERMSRGRKNDKQLLTQIEHSVNHSKLFPTMWPHNYSDITKYKTVLNGANSTKSQQQDKENKTLTKVPPCNGQ